MPRITLADIEKMRKKGELILENEKIERISKRVEEENTNSKNNVLKEISGLKKKDLEYEDFVSRIDMIKGLVNNLIDSTNDNNKVKISEDIFTLIFELMLFANDLNIDLEKGLKEVLKPLKNKKSKTSFTKLTGNLDKIL